ncbi:hypothetical protein DL93DRAFT_2171232 [Clavulina sp. PMI_390]|nr:hypothetical protein DL93DRAFT_2171232 [Clavulina sp. PMI_390]
MRLELGSGASGTTTDTPLMVILDEGAKSRRRVPRSPIEVTRGRGLGDAAVATGSLSGSAARLTPATRQTASSHNTALPAVPQAQAPSSGDADEPVIMRGSGTSASKPPYGWHRAITKAEPSRLSWVNLEARVAVASGTVLKNGTPIYVEASTSLDWEKKPAGAREAGFKGPVKRVIVVDTGEVSADSPPSYHSIHNKDELNDNEKAGNPAPNAALQENTQESAERPVFVVSGCELLAHAKNDPVNYTTKG